MARSRAGPAGNGLFYKGTGRAALSLRRRQDATDRFVQRQQPIRVYFIAGGERTGNSGSLIPTSVIYNKYINIFVVIIFAFRDIGTANGQVKI
jgi:hypothetical protein